jgi:hypothetical protein
MVAFNGGGGRRGRRPCSRLPWREAQRTALLPQAEEAGAALIDAGCGRCGAPLWQRSLLWAGGGGIGAEAKGAARGINGGGRRSEAEGGNAESRPMAEGAGGGVCGCGTSSPTYVAVLRRLGK